MIGQERNHGRKEKANFSSFKDVFSDLYTRAPVYFVLSSANFYLVLFLGFSEDLLT